MFQFLSCLLRHKSSVVVVFGVCLCVFTSEASLRSGERRKSLKYSASARKCSVRCAHSLDLAKTLSQVRRALVVSGFRCPVTFRITPDAHTRKCIIKHQQHLVSYTLVSFCVLTMRSSAMMRLMYLLVSALAIANGYPQYTKSSEDQIAASTDQHDDSDMYMEAMEHIPAINQAGQQEAGRSDGYVANSQQFYPSFAPFHNPPLGHSRPVNQQEAAYSHRPTAYQQQVGFDSTARFSGYKGDNANTGSSGGGDAHGILGSGNFGVIRGGTFYGDNDDADSFDQYNYYNGHGRPSFYFGGNPRPRQYQQFENFRDFADINVPTNPAYSQFVVVYANKNGSKPVHGVHANKPKNIMEHLALLDLERATSSTTSQPEKKLSKSKRKLAKIPHEKKMWLKKVKTSKEATTDLSTKNQPSTSTTISPDLYEPLLALS